MAWGLESAEQRVSLVVVGGHQPGWAEGWLGWVAVDLLESLESCGAGGGLLHDEGLDGGGQLLE